MKDLFNQEKETTTETVKAKRSTLRNVEITNYRSIKYLNIPMNELGIILQGMNGVGKTSVIEALYFLFSGKLFDGRARLGDQNITPSNMEKGTKTSVKATFESGFTFAITLWEEWNDDFSIVKERKSIYEVDGATVRRVGDAYSSLYSELGLSHIMNKYKEDPNLKPIDILRLFYDLRYLREIDYKELRAMVIDVVGDISYTTLINKNATKYSLLVEPLKESNLNLEATKQKLRGEKFGTPQNKSGLEQQISEYETIIQLTQKETTKEIDKTAIENAKQEIAKIDSAISDLKANKRKSDVELVRDIDLKISNLENDLLKAKNVVKEEHDKKVQAIKVANEKINEPLKVFESTKELLRQERLQLNEVIQSEDNKLTEKRYKLIDKKRELENHKEKRQTLVEEYKKASNPKSELITAPKSKEQFYLHEALEYVEIRNKQIAEITAKGQKEKLAIDGLIEGVETLTFEYDEQEKVVIGYQKQRVELDKKIKSNNETIEQEKAKITSGAKPLPELNFNVESVVSIEKELAKLNDERKALLTSSVDQELLYNEKIIELENKKEPLQEIVNQEVLLKDSERRLVEYQETLVAKKRRLLEVNQLLTLIKELEKDKYTYIDGLVADKFGDKIKFKLFDYNITDESINTRICDLLVLDGNNNWVNIKDLNTGNYPLSALDFITRLKKHYAIKPSFIFIDEFGVIDNNNRDKLLAFGEQIIATEKSESKKIEIVSI